MSRSLPRSLSRFQSRFVLPALLHTPIHSVRWLGIALCLLAAATLAQTARAAQDVVQFGNSIEVDKDATIHDAVCFFCSVNVKGTVNGDTVVFFGSARIDGRSNHDVVVLFGDVKLADEAAIGQDTVNIFGSTRLGENSSIGKDLVVIFGEMRMASTASVGGDRVVQPGWIFWVPFLVLFGGISLLVREIRGQRRRRFLRGY